MALLKGNTLVNRNGEDVPADEALKGKQLVLFYFSAGWCPPCRAFTPLLKDFYAAIKDDDSVSLEIVFVSRDKSEKDMLTYLKDHHGDWLGVKFSDPVADELKQKFNLTTIPLLVVTKPDGTLVTREARNDVTNKGVAAVKDWLN